MDTKTHNNIENRKVINFDKEHHIPASSDYDLDKKLTFESICCELISLHERKNKDYDGAFDKSMNKFGVVSLLIRLNDKFERLESLFKNGKAEVTDESFEDTLRDIACYAIMGLEHLYNTPNL